jgi:hypothetical protein
VVCFRKTQIKGLLGKPHSPLEWAMKYLHSSLNPSFDKGGTWSKSLKGLFEKRMFRNLNKLKFTKLTLIWVRKQQVKKI